jgi:Phage integrase family
LVTALLEWRRHLREVWLKKEAPMPEYVFPSETGTALEERNVRYAYARVVAKAELGDRDLYDMRHTFASQLLMAGAAITYVTRMGHSDCATTLKYYAHYLPEATSPAVGLLDTENSAIRIPAASDGLETDESGDAKSFGMNGEPRRNRTYNPQIKSLLLCQLS